MRKENLQVQAGRWQPRCVKAQGGTVVMRYFQGLEVHPWGGVVLTCPVEMRETVTMT